MKKRGIAVAGIALVIVAGIMLWFAIGGKVRLISFSPEEITSVVITNGNTGDMVELSKEEILLLLDVSKTIDCKRIYMEPSSGWNYSIDIESKGEWHKIILESAEWCKIKGDDYRIDSNQGEEVIKLLELFSADK